jgi:hypothetical protein
MFRFRSLVFAIVAAALVACGSVGTSTPQQQVASGCAASSAAIKALTIANDAGKLDAAQQSAILTAIGVIEPVCSAEVAPTLDTVKLAAFVQAIALLQAHAAKLEGNTP